MWKINNNKLFFSYIENISAIIKKQTFASNGQNCFQIQFITVFWQYCAVSSFYNIIYNSVRFLVSIMLLYYFSFFSLLITVSLMFIIAAALTIVDAYKCYSGQGVDGVKTSLTTKDCPYGITKCKNSTLCKLRYIK